MKDPWWKKIKLILQVLFNYKEINTPIHNLKESHNSHIKEQKSVISETNYRKERLKSEDSNTASKNATGDMLKYSYKITKI